jgi:hypothetical protein
MENLKMYDYWVYDENGWKWLVYDNMENLKIKMDDN